MDDDGPDFGEPEDCKPRVSLRDWFAGMAMQGILAHDSSYRRVNALCDGRPGNQRHPEEAMAVFAYEMADAMLKARQP